MKRRWRHRRFGLERKLRAHRPEPRSDFVRALANEIRDTPVAARSPLGRLGLASGLTGLVVVAIASFGGVGYASFTVAKKTEQPKRVAKIVSLSAAQAQYGTFTPPAAKPHKAAAAGAQKQQAPPKATAPSAQLPFTGLALWVPLAIGSLLIALGLILRTRGRRRDSTAQ
jgi:hypothetical protein